MKINVNGESVDTQATTLDELLVELGQENARVATAVNEIFVPVQSRSRQHLSTADRVEIVAPRQGG